MRFEGGICRWFAGRNDFEDSMTDRSISTCFLSVCLSICFVNCLYVSHSINYKLIINDFFLYVSLSLCLYFSLSLCLYVSLSLCLYVSLSLCLSVSMSLCLSVSLPLCLSASLSLCLFVSHSLILSVSLRLCLSVNLFLCLSYSLSFISLFSCTSKFGIILVIDWLIDNLFLFCWQISFDFSVSAWQHSAHKFLSDQTRCCCCCHLCGQFSWIGT
jgi:hypothetical protein